MAGRLDFAWRLPVALFMRAPLLVLGYLLEWEANHLIWLGQRVPGLPSTPSGKEGGE